jgi:hypothetical protein
MHVARKPVQLGDRDRATLAARLRKSSGKLRASIESIRAFAGFYLDLDLDQVEAFRRGEPFQGLFLRFDPEAGFALLCRRNPNVTDQFAWRVGQWTPTVSVPTAHRASTESRRSRAEPSRSRLVLACVVFAPNCTALCWSELRWSGLVSSWFGPHRSDLHCADPRRAATRRAEPSR